MTIAPGVGVGVGVGVVVGVGVLVGVLVGAGVGVAEGTGVKVGVATGTGAKRVHGLKRMNNTVRQITPPAPNNQLGNLERDLGAAEITLSEREGEEVALAVGGA